MQIFNTLFLILCLSLSNVAFASGEITKRSLAAPVEEAKPASIYDEDNKLALAEKQIQDLLARIEVLEHAVSQLQKQSANTEVTSPVVGAVIAPSMIKGQSDSAIISDVPEASSEKKEYDAALIALKNNQFEEAEVQFAHFIATYPKSNKLGNAYFWYGETFFKRNNFETAALNYLKGYKKFPKSEKAADSLLKLALSLGAMKKNKEACSMLAKLDSEFKNRPAASVKRANDAKNKYGCR
jgi:tol-pal system protein YbgF